jgi:hypothetical protein
MFNNLFSACVNYSHFISKSRKQIANMWFHCTLIVFLAPNVYSFLLFSVRDPEPERTKIMPAKQNYDTINFLDCACGQVIRKKYKQKYFFAFLKSMKKRVGSVSQGQGYGSGEPDPDPHLNVTDSHHCSCLYRPILNVRSTCVKGRELRALF